jgi:hypothetical protein
MVNLGPVKSALRDCQIFYHRLLSSSAIALSNLSSSALILSISSFRSLSSDRSSLRSQLLKPIFMLAMLCRHKDRRVHAGRCCIRAAWLVLLEGRGGHGLRYDTFRYRVRIRH